MKKVTLLVSLIAMVAIPAWTSAETTVRGRSASVIRSYDQTVWVDGQGPACDCAPPSCGAPSCGAPIGCSTPVCYGYESCGCQKCPGLLCAFRRVGRMLDCLLPCNKCCPGGCVFGCGACGGGGDCGGCRPHLFSRGRGCGGCQMGCTSCCPTCTDGVSGMMHGDGTMQSDPFLDDPTPPKPTPEAPTAPDADAPPEPSKEVRRPAWKSPYAAHMTRATAQNFGAFKVSAARPAATGMPVTNKPVASSTVQKINATPKATPAASSAAKPATKSVLRRASLEQELPAAEDVDAATEPALLPVAITTDTAGDSVPANPLRR